MQPYAARQLRARIEYLAIEIEKWPSAETVDRLVREIDAALRNQDAPDAPMRAISRAAESFLAIGSDNMECARRLREAILRLEAMLTIGERR